MANAKNRYPKKLTDNHGYIPKLQYWTTKLTEELNKEFPNLHEIDHIHRKLDWFIQKEWDRNIIVKTRDVRWEKNLNNK